MMKSHWRKYWYKLIMVNEDNGYFPPWQETERNAWDLLRSKNINSNPNSDAGLGSGVVDRRWTAFNAALGEKQRKWMEEELKMAEKRRESVVLFTHIPLHPKVKNEKMI